METLSESKLYMWRACMTILHLDGVITKGEKKWAEEKIHSLPISTEEKEILKADFAAPSPLQKLIPKITHAPDRAFLLHMVNVLGHLDGNFQESEQKVFLALQREIMGGLDMPTIKSGLQKSSTSPVPNNKASLLEHIYTSAQKTLSTKK